MRCKYCNIEIACKSKICPLCHEKIHLNENVDLPVEETQELKNVYPPKKREKVPVKKRLLSPTSIYLSVALAIFVICLVINLRITPTIYWFACVGAVLVYGLILTKHTILSNNSIGIKIFWQAMAVFAILLALNYIIKDQISDYVPHWIWDFGLPIILTVSTTVAGIYTSIAFHKWHSVILDALAVSSLGFIPIILYGCGVVHNPITSIICACLSSVAIILCSILGRRTLISEFKKKFHV